MKRPSFQFYPADWLSNTDLRLCSYAARGAWIEILCVLNDRPEYGVWRLTLKELAKSAKISTTLLKVLIKYNLLKGGDKGAKDYIFTPSHSGQEGMPAVLIVAGDGPCWYCTRMVRDEYIRKRRGSTTRFSAENQPSKGIKNGRSEDSPKPPFGRRKGDGPTSSSSSSSKSITPIPPAGGRGARHGAAIDLPAFLEHCKEADRKPIPEGAPIFTYCEQTGIPSEFLRLQWLEFKDRYGDGAKRYKDWPAVFSKSVRGNWFKLWFAERESGSYKLTTTGIQAEKVHKDKK